MFFRINDPLVKSMSKRKRPIDTFSEKRGRGRPIRMRPTEISGRSGNLRFILGQVWDRLWPLLSEAQDVASVAQAFKEGSQPYESNFVPHLVELTLQVIREPKWPKRRPAQVGFLADSLAAAGALTPRRSRDICAQQRTKDEKTTAIIRYEYWIECSCGYKGRSRNHACPSCEAKIVLGFDSSDAFIH